MYSMNRNRTQGQLQLRCSRWRTGESYSSYTCIRILLSVLLLQCLLTRSSALECSSTYTHRGSPVVARGNTHWPLPADWCRTDGACYVKVSLWESSFGQEISRGCLSKEDRSLLCDDSSNELVEGFKVQCCYEDHCNDVIKKKDEMRMEVRDLGANVRDKREASATTVTTATTEDGNMFKTTVILTAAICLIVMTTIIALVVTISVCCCCRHGNYRHNRGRRRHQQGDEELGQSDSRISFASSDCCEAIIPSGETLSNVLQSAHHHSSSPSLLVQRSVARHTMLGKTLAQGQFCDVYEGRWRSDRVLVKIYPSKYERLWFTETEVYQISHIPHPNVLNFVAAEIIQRNSQTFHHLICEYHERGTLFDHLQATPMDVHGLLVLAESIATGLAHLHSEIPNNQGMLVKPAIAHCNLTSKSIYVKLDGTCCIADLSLAIKDDRNLTSQLRGRPVTDARYLPPEFLERTDVETMDFASLRKADMYSFSLVLWEIARRCWIQGLVEEAALPYSDIAPSDQTTVEEMKELVCVQERRPPLADQWSLDESMGVVLRVMKECWHPKSEVRLTALRVKKTLGKLGDSVRPLLDKNGKISMQYEFDREKFHS